MITTEFYVSYGEKRTLFYKSTQNTQRLCIQKIKEHLEHYIVHKVGLTPNLVIALIQLPWLTVFSSNSKTFLLLIIENRTFSTGPFTQPDTTSVVGPFHLQYCFL